MKIMNKVINDAAESLGIDLSKYNMDQIVMGMDVELEHGTKNADKNLNVTDDDPIKTLQIALAHLEEVPDYYTKLKKYVETVEERYKVNGFDNFFSLSEDGESVDVHATLDSVPGIGEPVLPTRTTAGSGDIELTKKKKKKRIYSFDKFIKNNG